MAISSSTDLSAVPDTRKADISRHFSRSLDLIQARDVDPEQLYPPYNFSVPVDHFHNESRYEPHSDATFNLRYFFDASYYKEGGPVIVLQGGETDAAGRLPYLQKGIVYQLAKATGGIGVILEHRYYGTSFPTSDLSTANLRFLTTQQALADQAYFQQNVVFPGLEDKNLTAPGTPWIAYGGSYAGAFVAFMRTLYPDATWGAISSSGVTEAIYDYWQYYEPIKTYAPQECIQPTLKIINIADNILSSGDNSTISLLKSTFLLPNLTRADDFGSVISGPFSAWQSLNWDPSQSSPSFSYLCNNISSTSLLYPSTARLSNASTTLISAGGYANETTSLLPHMLNYIGYLNSTSISRCRGSSSQDSCFSSYPPYITYFDDRRLSNFDSISWPYQTCTQWGYYASGSGVPPSAGLPLLSRYVTPEYDSIFCNYAFNITTPPNVAEINQYGGFGITAPRLAIIGGQTDPWRPATPLADDAPTRTGSETEPVVLIEGAVHHWDENGVFPNETRVGYPPAAVVEAQSREVKAVMDWMVEFNAQKKSSSAVEGVGSGRVAEGRRQRYLLRPW
ncbi:MAG: hypothetical protein Q9227_008630 [Pyrenula ochraceoflavens]